MNKSQQRALLVDDHKLVRHALRRMIEVMDTPTEIVGESSSGIEALRLIDELDIDLLITDLSMPDIDGVALIRKAMRRKPDLKCIVLSMHTSREYVLAALQAGACGYVHKNASAEELRNALESAYQGTSYLHPSVASSVVDLVREAADIMDPLSLVTERQRDVLKLVAEGKSTRDIAELLSLSVKTVETHRKQLMERLEIFDVPGLVKLAIRSGLVDL